VKFEQFIARRLTNRSLPGYTRPLIRIAIAGVALSITVMMLSVMIVTGFQRAISSKVVGFSGHLQVSRYDANQGLESSPISLQQTIYTDPAEMDVVEHIQPYATKAGMLKTEDQIEGIVLKGIWTDYDWSRFSGELLRGHWPRITDSVRSDEIIISSRLASRLLLDTGSIARAYFISGENGMLRGRRFVVSGIYQTGMEEFDRMYILGDIRHVQRLNGWDSLMVSGFELFLKPGADVRRAGEEIYRMLPYDVDARTVFQIFPHIYDWLKLQDMNVAVILTLMILVASITMISALLIIILERISLIGVLKALGASGAMVRRIFILQAVRIIASGLLIGNAVALAVAFLQLRLGFLKLDQESYYVSEVPIYLDATALILLNVAAMALCLLAMLIPTAMISRILPVRVIHMG